MRILALVPSLPRLVPVVTISFLDPAEIPDSRCCRYFSILVIARISPVLVVAAVAAISPVLVVAAIAAVLVLTLLPPFSLLPLLPRFSPSRFASRI